MIPNIQNWWKQIAIWREKNSFEYCQIDENELKPQYVLDEIYQKTKDFNPYFVTDVGQHQMWAAQYCKVDKPRRFITSGGLGTMGFGLPAAIGAQIAKPNDMVILITGDGSIMMLMSELATAVKYKLSIKIVILNNRCLGMVRQWQEMFYDERYSESDLMNSSPDFIKLADAFGIKSHRATNVLELNNGLIDMVSHDSGAYLLEIIIKSDENTYPMIAPGKGHNEMLFNV